jgi:hypothetical protein
MCAEGKEPLPLPSLFDATNCAQVDKAYLAWNADPGVIAQNTGGLSIQ